jgi:hypothetical protein
MSGFFSSTCGRFAIRALIAVATGGASEAPALIIDGIEVAGAMAELSAALEGGVEIFQVSAPPPRLCATLPWSDTMSTHVSPAVISQDAIESGAFSGEDLDNLYEAAEEVRDAGSDVKDAVKSAARNMPREFGAHGRQMQGRIATQIIKRHIVIHCSVCGARGVNKRSHQQGHKRFHLHKHAGRAVESSCNGGYMHGNMYMAQPKEEEVKNPATTSR